MRGKLQKNISAIGLYEQLVKHQLHSCLLVECFPMGETAPTREMHQH